MFPLRKECYKLGLDGVPLPAHECVPSPNCPVMLLDRALRLNTDLEEAVGQPEEPMLAVVHSVPYLVHLLKASAKAQTETP